MNVSANILDVRALVEAALDDGHHMGSIFKIVRSEFGLGLAESIHAVAQAMNQSDNPKWLRVRNEWAACHGASTERYGI